MSEPVKLVVCNEPECCASLKEAESRLSEAEKQRDEWKEEYIRFRDGIKNLVFPPRTQISRDIDNYRPDAEALRGEEEMKE